MILKISVNKARYEKGQIFPFLIAIIAVIIIIAMITLNLGQIAIFKTDVSNAADAAALAGASTLSGYLLGIGLQSDMMCGEMLVAVAAILIEVITVIGIPIAIATYIAYLVRMLVTYFQALEEGKMAWSNAKKTAMQYAFQNAGIDEQRPSFKEFLKGVYDVSDPYNLPKADTAAYYNIYSLGDDINASTDTRKDKPMGRINIYLILAIISFGLSFVTPRYFIQLLTATLLLGAKWVIDSKTTKMLVMIHEAWKTDGERGASEVIKRFDLNAKTRHK